MLVKLLLKIPPSCFNLIFDNKKLGCSTLIVGGSIRDALIKGHFPKDIDMEIRLENRNLQDFYLELQNRYPENSFQQLPFGILKMSSKEMTVEFSPPREEIYQGQGPFGHSDFSFRIDHQLDFQRSFARRDLTINAIGLGPADTPEGWAWVDPFGGRDDIAVSCAKHCSEDFFKDPVRFTRLIRFCLQLGLKMDDELKKNLGQFNLVKLTPYYFFKDSLKVPFFKWTKMFFSLQNEHGILLGNEIEKLRFLQDIDDNEFYQDREEVLKKLIVENIPQKQLEIFCRFAGISLKKIKKINLAQQR